MTIATDLIHAAKSRGLDDPIWCKPSAYALTENKFYIDQQKQYVIDCQAFYELIGSRKLTVKELCKETGITEKTIYKRLKSLVDEGKVIKTASKPPFKYYQNPNYKSDKN